MHPRRRRLVPGLGRWKVQDLPHALVRAVPGTSLEDVDVDPVQLPCACGIGQLFGKLHAFVLVIGLLKHRLGTPLIESFQNALTQDDGRGPARDGRPRTGTEWELDTALRRFDESRRGDGETRAKPRVFIYQSTAAAPGETSDDSDESRRRTKERRLQLDWLRDYLADLRAQERWPIPFGEDDDLAGTVAETLRGVLLGWLEQATRSTPAAAEAESAHRPASVADIEPYPGLDPYDERHASVYFGRDADQTRLRNRVQQTPRFLCVAGASGSGKSSLARATFTRAAVEALGWLRMEMFPGNAPLDALAGALHHAGAGRAEAIARRLGAEGAEAFAALAAQVLSAGRTERLMIIVDQFEEIFSADDTVQARALLDLIRDTAGGSAPVFWLATLRSDFLDTFTNHPSLRRLVNENVLHHVTPMGEEALRSVIERPLACVRTPAGGCYSIDPELTEWLVRETLGEDEREENLPLLNYALREIFTLARPEGVSVLGFDHVAPLAAAGDESEAAADARGKLSLSRVLERSADDAYASLGDAAQARDAVFARIAEPPRGGARRWTRRRASKRELLEAHPGASTFLDVFSGASSLGGKPFVPLLRTGEGGTVEVCHERLFRCWPLLRDWLQEREADLSEQVAAEFQAARWAAHSYRARDHDWCADRIARLRDVLAEFGLGGAERNPSLHAFLHPAERLLATLDNAETTPAERHYVGELLADLGEDERPGVGLDAAGLPDIRWVDVSRATVALSTLR